ncbi:MULTISPECIES: DUF1444 domain-containing protein [Mesobacillus]|jgi:uncharacterized protein YtpQ (UPF0354 family)|uniref:DUF1444 domain-containing protein n=1 Tax=Mesobacillus TaxID=2675231 RepID=UPI00177AE2F0|nr:MULTISPECIES: DUF1444 domain-containing protein [Mesobacillus]MCM3572240.1 DUF1444 domain-containing protein [Mesobacillus subterraneus]UYZ21098.1 DUF1444 domain-containing protein [Mesobacillus jeotgali]
MDSRKMRKELENRLQHPDRTFSYDREKDQLRIENITTGRGITIALPGIVAKWQDQKEKAIDEVVYYVSEGLNAMESQLELSGKEKNIFPVIRSTSFPTEAEEGVPFLYDDHTAETRIYYALDLGTTYRLIDSKLLKKEGWSAGQVRETALFNVRSLSVKIKEDRVAENTFYFLNTNDGYDASRILNTSFLNEMKKRMKGTMTVAVPHQDVLIIADVENNTGYDILAQMTMSFFASGRVPITALSFLYEDGELEPIFILGKTKKE